MTRAASYKFTISRETMSSEKTFRGARERAGLLLSVILTLFAVFAALVAIAAV